MFENWLDEALPPQSTTTRPEATIVAGPDPGHALSEHGPASQVRSTDHRWLKCSGCRGDIGIPSDWVQSTVDCPQCGTAAHLPGRVLYRPAADGQPTGSHEPRPSCSTPVVPPSARRASLELGRKADGALTCGILSVLLGWTVLVPFVGLCFYNEALTLAKNERVPVPGKATTGLILSLLFGIAQGLAVLIRLNR